MDISLCLEPLFPELDFVDRIGRAASLGFRTIEFWDPANKDLDRVARSCREHGVRVSDCCVAAPWADARLHASTEAVLRKLEATLPLLERIGCRKAILLTGEVEPGATAEEQRRRIVANLRALGPVAKHAGVTLLLEPLNSAVDHKGYFLDSSDAGFQMIREVNHPNVRLLFDVYHMQIMEGNIIDRVTRNIELIGHFHAAGVPGRHELYTGELEYRHIIEAIEGTGYRGAFGLEFWPTGDHTESLRRTLEYLGRG
jgi:hydroxypyruvate isomerase